MCLVHNAIYVVVFSALLARCFAAELREEHRHSVRELTKNNGSTDRSSYKGTWTPETATEDQTDPSFHIDSDYSSYDAKVGDQPFSFDRMGSIAKENNFKKTQQFKADYTEAEITQYESQRTGMNVVVVDRKGPKVYGYFALATEIHDDSGARE